MFYVVDNFILTGGSAPGLFQTLVGIVTGVIFIVGSLPWVLITNIPVKFLPFTVFVNCMIVGLVSGVLAGFHREQ